MIEIACSADEHYLPHVSAMLHSLLTSTPTRPLRVWLLHGRALSEAGCARVVSVVEGLGGQIEFIRVPDEHLVGFPTRKFHYSCWYRILLPELLPQLDRVLYLDCDIIVTDDLTPLWSTELGEHRFAACVNPLYRPMLKPVRALGIEQPRDYLNSGVLLLDLARLRVARLSDTLRAYAQDHPDNACPEQDALSVTQRGHWLSLHPRWNAQTALYDEDLPRSMSPFPETVAREAVERPAVMHFNGPFKPWQYSCRHPKRALYFVHLRGTPWPETPLTHDALFFRLIRPLSIDAQYRAMLYLYLPVIKLQSLLQRGVRRLVYGRGR